MHPGLFSFVATVAAPAAAVARGAVLGVAVLATLHPSIVHPGIVGHRTVGEWGTASAWPDAPRPRRADFGAVTPSADARAMADWIAGVDDNRGATVAIVDKKNARLYVFDGGLRLAAASPVLLGAALGDVAVPGIGERPLARVRPDERTTPAGRFVAERGHNARGEDVVWVDYDAAVSMHRVITTQPAERRLERLASPAPADHRISYGCINVPVAFYESVVRPAFAGRRGIVYVLPDRASIHAVFGA